MKTLHEKAKEILPSVRIIVYQFGRSVYEFECTQLMCR